MENSGIQCQDSVEVNTNCNTTLPENNLDSDVFDDFVIVSLQQNIATHGIIYQQVAASDTPARPLYATLDLSTARVRAVKTQPICQTLFLQGTTWTRFVKKWP